MSLFLSQQSSHHAKSRRLISHCSVSSILVFIPASVLSLLYPPVCAAHSSGLSSSAHYRLSLYSKPARTQASKLARFTLYVLQSDAQLLFNGSGNDHRNGNPDRQYQHAVKSHLSAAALPLKRSQSQAQSQSHSQLRLASAHHSHFMPSILARRRRNPSDAQQELAVGPVAAAGAAPGSVIDSVNSSSHRSSSFLSNTDNAIGSAPNRSNSPGFNMSSYHKAAMKPSDDSPSLDQVHAKPHSAAISNAWSRFTIRKQPPAPSSHHAQGPINSVSFPSTAPTEPLVPTSTNLRSALVDPDRPPEPFRPQSRPSLNQYERLFGYSQQPGYSPASSDAHPLPNEVPQESHAHKPASESTMQHNRPRSDRHHSQRDKDKPSYPPPSTSTGSSGSNFFLKRAPSFRKRSDSNRSNSSQKQKLSQDAQHLPHDAREPREPVASDPLMIHSNFSNDLSDTAHADRKAAKQRTRQNSFSLGGSGSGNGLSRFFSSIRRSGASSNNTKVSSPQADPRTLASKPIAHPIPNPEVEKLDSPPVAIISAQWPPARPATADSTNKGLRASVKESDFKVLKRKLSITRKRSQPSPESGSKRQPNASPQSSTQRSRPATATSPPQNRSSSFQDMLASKPRHAPSQSLPQDMVSFSQSHSMPGATNGTNEPAPDSMRSSSQGHVSPATGPSRPSSKGHRSNSLSLSMLGSFRPTPLDTSASQIDANGSYDAAQSNSASGLARSLSKRGLRFLASKRPSTAEPARAHEASTDTQNTSTDAQEIIEDNPSPKRDEYPPPRLPQRKASLVSRLRIKRLNSASQIDRPSTPEIESWKQKVNSPTADHDELGSKRRSSLDALTHLNVGQQAVEISRSRGSIRRKPPPDVKQEEIESSPSTPLFEQTFKAIYVDPPQGLGIQVPASIPPDILAQVKSDSPRSRPASMQASPVAADTPPSKRSSLSFRKQPDIPSRSLSRSHDPQPRRKSTNGDWSLPTSVDIASTQSALGLYAPNEADTVKEHDSSPTKAETPTSEGQGKATVDSQPAPSVHSSRTSMEGVKTTSVPAHLGAKRPSPPSSRQPVPSVLATEVATDAGRTPDASATPKTQAANLNTTPSNGKTPQQALLSVPSLRRVGSRDGKDSSSPGHSHGDISSDSDRPWSLISSCEADTPLLRLRKLVVDTNSPTQEREGFFFKPINREAGGTPEESVSQGLSRKSSHETIVRESASTEDRSVSSHAQERQASPDNLESLSLQSVTDSAADLDEVRTSSSLTNRSDTKHEISSIHSSGSSTLKTGRFFAPTKASGLASVPTSSTKRAPIPLEMRKHKEAVKEERDEKDSLGPLPISPASPNGITGSNRWSGAPSITSLTTRRRASAASRISSGQYSEGRLSEDALSALEAEVGQARRAEVVALGKGRVADWVGSNSAALAVGHEAPVLSRSGTLRKKTGNAGNVEEQPSSEPAPAASGSKIDNHLTSRVDEKLRELAESQRQEQSEAGVQDGSVSPREEGGESQEYVNSGHESLKASTDHDAVSAGEGSGDELRAVLAQFDFNKLARHPQDQLTQTQFARLSAFNDRRPSQTGSSSGSAAETIHFADEAIRLGRAPSKRVRRSEKDVKSVGEAVIVSRSSFRPQLESKSNGIATSETMSKESTSVHARRGSSTQPKMSGPSQANLRRSKSMSCTPVKTRDQADTDVPLSAAAAARSIGTRNGLALMRGHSDEMARPGGETEKSSASKTSLESKRSVMTRYATSEEAALAKQRENAEREGRQKEKERKRQLEQQRKYAMKKKSDPLLAARLALVGLEHESEPLPGQEAASQTRTVDDASVRKRGVNLSSADEPTVRSWTSAGGKMGMAAEPKLALGRQIARKRASGVTGADGLLAAPGDGLPYKVSSLTGSMTSFHTADAGLSGDEWGAEGLGGKQVADYHHDDDDGGNGLGKRSAKSSQTVGSWDTGTAYSRPATSASYKTVASLASSLSVDLEFPIPPQRGREQLSEDGTLLSRAGLREPWWDELYGEGRPGERPLGWKAMRRARSVDYKARPPSVARVVEEGSLTPRMRAES